MLFVAFPIWFVITWVLATVLRGHQGNWYEAILFYLPVVGMPLVAGGLLQQLVLLTLPTDRVIRGRRTLAVISALVIVPTVFLLFRSDPGMLLSPGVSVPLGIALLGYGLLMRLS
jgi:hypothetical protein